MKYVLLLGVLVVSACSVPRVDTNLVDEEVCSANAYQPFVGQSVAALTVPQDRPFRVITDRDPSPGAFVPTRTTVLFDDEDPNQRILRVFCG